jgi:hypothetical protein
MRSGESLDRVSTIIREPCGRRKAPSERGKRLSSGKPSSIVATRHASPWGDCQGHHSRWCLSGDPFRQPMLRGISARLARRDAILPVSGADGLASDRGRGQLGHGRHGYGVGRRPAVGSFISGPHRQWRIWSPTAKSWLKSSGEFANRQGTQATLACAPHTPRECPA